MENKEQSDSDEVASRNISDCDQVIRSRKRKKTKAKSHNFKRRQTRKKRREAVTASNSTAETEGEERKEEEEEVEVTEEYYLLDLDRVGGEERELEPIDVRKSNIHLSDYDFININNNSNLKVTRQSASLSCTVSQAYSEKSEEWSSQESSRLDESELGLCHESNEDLQACIHNSLNNLSIANTNQVYSEESEERSSQKPTGVDESKLEFTRTSEKTSHACDLPNLSFNHFNIDACNLTNSSFSNVNNVNVANNNGQVYPEQSEERSGQEPTGLDESELDLFHDDVEVSHNRRLSERSSNASPVGVFNSQRSERGSNSDLMSLDGSQSVISSNDSNSRSCSIVSIDDYDEFENSEELSDSGLTNSDESMQDITDDDILSESAVLCDDSDIENLPQDEQNAIDSNSEAEFDNFHRNEFNSIGGDMESEFESNKENSSSLPNSDSINDAQTNTETPPVEKSTGIDSILNGCRITELAHLIKEFTKLGHSKNHQIHCSRRGENFYCYEKKDVGLNTLLYWKCLECRLITTFWTNPVKPKNKFSINETAAINVIGSASSFKSFQTVLAVFDIPYLTSKTYQKHRKNQLVEPLKEALAEEMHKNALEEAAIAIKNGDVTPDGIPLIKVMTDGFYGKRSYRGGRHDSLSASVAVIGCATQKVLDVEVVNKYCITCRKYENRGLKPPPHKCYMNYDRKKSSSSMEPYATAILFNRSMKLHGVIYHKMVSDDDSSTIKVVKESKPYAEYNVEVERIKCSFHKFRSTGTKIREASKAKVPNRRVPASVRNRIKYSALKIRRTVTADIKRLRKDFESDTLTKAEKEQIFVQNTEVLRKNILLVAPHVFGDHSQCPSEWSCDKSKPNHVPKLKEYGLYARVEKIMTDLSQDAVHLLHFLNTNKIEQYHGILAKYLSGKRIQYGGADELQDRVYMGTLDQITSGAHLSIFYKFAKKSIPESITKLEKEQSTQKLINKKSREVNKQRKKDRRTTYQGPDKDYGANAAQPDLCETDPDAFQKSKENHHDKLRERQRKRNILEVETRNHPFGVPHSYEKDMIPSNMFGKICRMLDTTSCKTVINDIYNPVLYDDDDDVLLSMENLRLEALQVLESEINYKIQPCGIFVSQDVESFYLCARPDGLVNDDSIVVVVNLSDNDQTDVQTALNNNRNMKNLFDKKSPDEINQNHGIYYNIQGQLHVTNRLFCYFAVFTPKELKIAEIIRKDDNFWKSKMKNKLNRFYYSALIDEIVDSRLLRSMPIREAAFTLEAKAKKLQKDADKLVTQSQQQSNNADNDDENISRNDHDEQTIINYRAFVVNREVGDLKNNIMGAESYLSDVSISRFLMLLEGRNFTIDLPITAADPLKPSTSTNDLVIIGGQPTYKHWSCFYFDGHNVAIYDSMNREKLQLSALEIKYLKVRYPQQFKDDKLIFKFVTKQPDLFSCGVYAAAYATSIVFGVDPSTLKYSENAHEMRNHFYNVICNNELLQFPCTSNN